MKDEGRKSNVEVMTYVDEASKLIIDDHDTTSLATNDRPDVALHGKSGHGSTNTSKYGTLEDKRTNETKRFRSRTKSALSWVSSEISYGIGDSLNIHLAGALMSHDHIPSSDRVSTAFLMGVNLQSMILGTSLLSIPFCVKIAGFWGIVMIVVVGLFSLLTADVLTDCQYEKSYSEPGFYKRVNVSFVDMANSCWKVGGDYLSKIFVYLSLARNVVVIILLTDIVNCVLRNFNVPYFDKKLISVFWTLAVLPLLFIRRVSRLAWVSFVGLNLYLVVIFAVLILCCFEYRSWNLSNISMKFDVDGVGIATGIIINSYAVHMNLPALEGSLRHPRSYRRTSAVSFVVNVIIKVAFGVCGYLTYTAATEQEITNNVHEYRPLPILLQISVMFFSYFTIPLQSFVVFELIDNTFRPHFPACDSHDLCWMLVSRTFVMLLCLLVAVLIPNFSVVVGLIGSLRGSMICLILPALFYIKLQRRYKCGDTLRRIACYLTVVFETVAAVVGVYASLKAIVFGKSH